MCTEHIHIATPGSRIAFCALNIPEGSEVTTVAKLGTTQVFDLPGACTGCFSSDMIQKVSDFVIYIVRKKKHRSRKAA